MNTDTTQAAIAELYTSQTDDNIITAQVQIPRMVRQRGVNSVATNNDVSVNVLGSSKRFSIQYNEDGRVLSMRISKIATRNCHVSSNYSTKYDVEDVVQTNMPPSISFSGT